MPLPRQSSKRSELVALCQKTVTLAGIDGRVDKCLRLWAVATVYGVKEARKLGIGKVRAFEASLYREKDSEVWGFKDTLTEAQRTTLQAVWQMACSTAMTAQGVEDEIRVGMGKEPAKPAAPKP